jgi:hypothetical protein
MRAVCGAQSSTRHFRELRPGSLRSFRKHSHFKTHSKASPLRYRALAALFADDRLWVNSASTVCTQFFAVELASLGGQKTLSSDCGGRAPTYDTPNVWRSLLIAGASSGVTDGLHQDEHPPSDARFPFLAPPDPKGVNH